MIAAGLHIGIDAYPAGNALQCCVRDAKGMAQIFGGKLLLDREATRQAIMEAVSETVRKPKAGEWAVVTYSGHGAQLPDQDGDEPEGLDEVIVDVNLDVIRDDEFQGLLKGRHRQARILLVADSCYSGTISRAAPVFTKQALPALRKNNVRYLPRAVLKPVSRAENRGPQKALPNVVVVSGCADFELSFENEKYGVLSGAIFKCYEGSLRIKDVGARVAKEVEASGYPQHPQLVCSKAALKWPVPRK